MQIIRMVHTIKAAIKYVTSSPAQNMKKIIAGRLDLVMDSPIVVKALMNNEFTEFDRHIA